MPLGGGLLDATAVAEAVDRLDLLGYGDVVTSALTPGEQRPFLDHGFIVAASLDLLVLDLLDGWSPTARRRRSGPVPRRLRRRDVPRVLEIDAAAFAALWAFDHVAHEEARRATPACRRRVVRIDRRTVGYVVTGRSDDQGFVQRLAVDPDHQGAGLGRRLLDDALGWLHRRGARRVHVNTQPDNDAALALYRDAGFVVQPGGLAVLRLRRSDPPPA